MGITRPQRASERLRSFLRDLAAVPAPRSLSGLCALSKPKVLISGEQREYVYYRCARYNEPGHSRGGRVREETLDEQVLALFDRLRVDDPEIREWFVNTLRARTRATQQIAVQVVEALASNGGPSAT